MWRCGSHRSVLAAAGTNRQEAALVPLRNHQPKRARLELASRLQPECPQARARMPDARSLRLLRVGANAPRSSGIARADTRALTRTRAARVPDANTLPTVIHRWRGEPAKLPAASGEGADRAGLAGANDADCGADCGALADVLTDVCGALAVGRLPTMNRPVGSVLALLPP